MERDREWIEQTWTGAVSHVAVDTLAPYIDQRFHPLLHYCYTRHIDPGHLFGKETQKIVVLCWRRGRAMGTMVSRTLAILTVRQSPTVTTQQDCQRGTQTAKNRSRYTYTYPSHFIRTHASFAARTFIIQPTTLPPFSLRPS